MNCYTCNEKFSDDDANKLKDAEGVALCNLCYIRQLQYRAMYEDDIKISISKQELDTYSKETLYQLVLFRFDTAFSELKRNKDKETK